MKKNHFLVAVFSLFSPIVFAGAMGLQSTQTEISPFIGISIGPAWAQGAKTQTLFVTPTIFNSYRVHKASHVVVNGELFLGFSCTLLSNLQSQWGIALAAATYDRFSGFVWDQGNPLFANHNYHYQVKHKRIAAKLKLFKDFKTYLSPWLSASAGVGFNHTDDFRVEALVDNAKDSSIFRSHSQNSFSYNLGLGLQRQVATHWTISLGYEFADWGKSQLGSAPLQTTNSRLRLKHLYTNAFVYTMTYQR